MNAHQQPVSQVQGARWLLSPVHLCLGVFCPIAGLGLALSAFAFDEQLAEGALLSWLHAVAAFATLPISLIAGAFCAVRAWRRSEARLVPVMIVFFINLAPLLLLLIALAWPLGG